MHDHGPHSEMHPRGSDASAHPWHLSVALRDAGRAIGRVDLDLRCMGLPADWEVTYGPRLARALQAMQALEAGSLANADEGRMVGHYWLRAPHLAPTPALRQAIESALQQTAQFVAAVHSGQITGGTGRAFRNLLVIGIGGSALGPQLASAALTTPADRLRVFFFDNTDPDGFERTLAALDQSHEGLKETLVVVISKSGGTKETRNGLLYAQRAFAQQDLSFAEHAVAVTGEGSELYRTSVDWLAQFPMWDWVGGRTSELSCVGLLPAALQGLDIDGMLAGARAMDERTRVPVLRQNPAALLAMAWHHATGGRGLKDMVVLPYRDRLELFSRYLQQLVMESLGKELDRDGQRVNQGISVYGNKGSTDQHAYVQQLRDGVSNFFVTFIESLKDRSAHVIGPDLYVEPHVTSGDYLLGFQLGTERALSESGRPSLTLTLGETSAVTLGALIALYERAVGLYAELVHINAYHQPGVEAGKRAAAEVLRLQHLLLTALSDHPETAEQLAQRTGSSDAAFTAWKILEHLAANDRIDRVCGESDPPTAARYRLRAG